MDRVENPADLLQLRRGGSGGELEELALVVWRRAAGHGADLGVADLALSEGVVTQGENGERAGHADLFAGGAEGDAAAPVQPVGAGGGALGGPELVGVEVANVGEETVGAGVEHGGSFGNPIGERLDFDIVHEGVVPRGSFGSWVARGWLIGWADDARD